MTSSPVATVDIPTPDDWHVHLRDDEMLGAVAPLTARRFRYALVMPNLVPPLATTAAVAAYRDRILAAVGPAGAATGFTPVMAAYLHPDLTGPDLRAGYAAGVVGAVKYYPAGATTNSEYGGASLLGFRPLLEMMAAGGIPLLVHAESTDPEIDIFDRERVFLDRELAPVVEALPELAVTVEHLSTRAGVEFVAAHDQVRGTITPHHLACDRTDLLANGLRPDLYCKPIVNSPADRRALVAAAISGRTDLFLGTDSAPHPTTDKYAATARPGVFNAPYALEVVAEVFHRHGALDRLAGFVSVHGAAHYGHPPAATTVRLTRREPAPPPDGGTGDGGPDRGELVVPGGQRVRIFGVAEAARWRVGTPSDPPSTVSPPSV
ncbi:MAG: dihydroorotase [Acidimicrobiales bacterium]